MLDFNSSLTEFIVANKIDLDADGILAADLQKRLNKTIHPISAVTGQGVKELSELATRDYRPATWEGVVVRMSDKIAYLGRDLEDAVRRTTLWAQRGKAALETIPLAETPDESRPSTVSR